MSCILTVVALLNGLLPADPPATIPRLPPAAFTRLPSSVRKQLVAQRCLIPQPWPYEGKPRNIVAGHFRSRRREDYAALCSRGGTSFVLVLNGRSGAILGKLNSRPDLNYVQVVRDQEMAYSRVIERVAPSKRGFCFEEDAPCACRQSTYDGINDLFEGKASETHCWQSGWHTVLSGD